MTTFMDLYITGKDLKKMVEKIENYVKNEFEEKWTISTGEDVFFITSTYKQVKVCLVFQNYELKNKIEVTNVVPVNRHALSVEEYNETITYFTNEILIPFIQKYNLAVEINKTSGEMTLSDIFGSKAEQLLREYISRIQGLSIIEVQQDLYRCKEWYDFILTSFSIGKMCYNFEELTSYLKELISNFEIAEFLATDYVRTISFLSYYEGEYKFRKERI